MNRTGAGILACVVMLTLLAGPASRSSTGYGKTGIQAKAGIEQTEKSEIHKNVKSPPCDSTVSKFKVELLEAVQLSLSYGLGDQPDPCPETFSIEEKKRPSVAVIFAILPDPVHTNLSLLFDRQIDALQQGIMDSGWTFERALMPWDNKQHAESTDFRIRLLQEAFEETEQNQPGLLIFRRDQVASPSKSDAPPPPAASPSPVASPVAKASPPPQAQSTKLVTHLLVFVIAESPTGGIYKTQFRTASSLTEQLLGKNQPTMLNILGILGPTFTGSLKSLSDLLECGDANAPSCSKHFQIVSGTITGAVDLKTIHAEACGAPYASRLKFCSFQENDEYAQHLFLHFAREEWQYDRRDIAILSEDESAYGGQMRADDNQITPKSQETDAEDKDVTRLFFPREISQLRSAYQRNAAGQTGAQDKPPRSTLPIDLESSGSDDDTVREYSGRQLPLSQESIMLGIVGELRKHQAKIVMLRATDPLDLIFLSRYLRQAYPDARIVTISSDLLFAREVEDARLHGVMALTTYSLTPGADHDFQDGAQRHVDRVFPATHSVGTYNATKFLLASTNLDSPSRACAKQPTNNGLTCVHLFEYGWPQRSAALPSSAPAPVHLTVLGHDGYWELAVLPLFPPSSPIEGDPANALTTKDLPKSSLPRVYDPFENHILKRAQEPESAGSWLLWALAIGVSLAYVYFIWCASMLSSWQGMAHLAPPQFDARRHLLTITAFLHFGLLITVLWSIDYNFRLQHPVIWRLDQILVVTIVVLPCCDLLRRKCRWHAIILACACILTLIVLSHSWRQDYFHVMSIERGIHFASGVSHVLSVLLFLVAGLWGSWYSLSGSSLLDYRRTILPKRCQIDDLAVHDSVKNRLKGLRPIMEEDQSRLTRLLSPAHINPWAALLYFSVIVLVLYATKLRPLHALEPRTDEYLLAGLAVFSFTLIVFGVIRLAGIWAELRRLLIALDGCPLRSGFDRLAGLTWSPLWRLGAGTLGDFRRLISRQSEALRCFFTVMSSEAESLQKAFAEQADKTRVAFDTAADHYLQKWRWQSITNGPQSPSLSPASITHTSPWAAIATTLKGCIIPEQVKMEQLLLNEFGKLQDQFSIAGLHCLAIAVSEWDKANTMAAAGGECAPIDGNGAESKTPSLQTSARKTAVEEKRDAAEQFLVLLYTSFVALALTRVRTLIMAIGGMYVLFVLALTTYPFQPQVEIRLFLMVLLFSIVAIVGGVYAQMHRDSTLSHITRTQPGQLGISFWMRIGSFVALPVFSLLVSNYPELGNIVYSWLAPALHALQ
jgi:hypothetical protein